MDHKLKSKVIFVHPKELSFFPGVVVGKTDSAIRYRGTPTGISYMVETIRREIYYIEERFVFTDMKVAEENIFEALQKKQTSEIEK